jgi:hypothetical protein
MRRGDHEIEEMQSQLFHSHLSDIILGLTVDDRRPSW